MPQKDICVGIIKGAFGVKGEVRFLPLTENAQDIETYGRLHSQTGLKDIELVFQRPLTQGHCAVRLSCVKTREDALALRGTKLFAQREALPETDDDDFYYSDLVGLHVKKDGQVIGKVKSVQNFGAGDLLHIYLSSENTELYIPFTKACVPVVSVPDGFVEICPPEELD
jgi:16S rRNA processing protein RimM